MMSSTSCLLLLLLATLSYSACPTGTPGVVEDSEMGCVWADSDEDHRYDTYAKAEGRCKELLGESAHLVEVLDERQQGVVVTAMVSAETNFTIAEPCITYWWSSLKDNDNDGTWTWMDSETDAVYTNWHPRAVPGPEFKDFDCMQFVSGSCEEGMWMTFLCGDTYINTHPLCQLK